MNTLIEILRKETETLRVQYVAMTEQWAANEFQSLRQWAADYHAGKFGFSEASKKYHKLPYCIVNSTGKQEQYVQMMVKNSIDHYNSSIEKLAERIEKKGLNQDTLQVATSHIGVNIESVLTDGEKTVRAFTIIAAGEVQRPHYRYLIK